MPPGKLVGRLYESVARVFLFVTPASGWPVCTLILCNEIPFHVCQKKQKQKQKQTNTE